MDKIIVFTDGSAKNNGKKGAKASYAVVFPDYSEYNYKGILEGEKQTNNRAEYYALIKALEICDIIDKDKKIIVYSDSKLLINSINSWISKWKSNGWITSKGSPVLNMDLLIKIDEMINLRNVTINHVYAHTNNTDYYSYWNNIVDKLAQSI